MENICLESMWVAKLKNEGWSEVSAMRFPLHWASSTLQLYNGLLKKLWVFCTSRDIVFPPPEESQLAEFMINVTKQSQRPQSILKSTLAAVSCLYRVKALEDISQKQQIHYFKDALVKGGTVKPMEKSKVMPIKAFKDLFKSWSDNQSLSTRDLRLKAITLMAFVLMLRPSDIAPKGRRNVTVESVEVTKLVFSSNNIKCLEDGGMLISFFGTKNDSGRTGFEVHMPPSTDAEIDPCSALKEYITRTESIRPKPENPVFLTLKKPYRALDASTIGDIMNESIKLAGLGGKGYSAKSFRPTGATVAIETNQNPAQVMKTGRWKTQSVFLDHYVHAKNPDSYSDSVLGVMNK